MGTETLEHRTKSRAILYDWFSKMILLEPNEENFAPFVADNVIQELQELLHHKEYGHTFIRSMLRWQKDHEYRKELLLDFHALLKVPVGNYLYPYESCYREKNIDQTMGNIYGCSTMEVQQIFKTLNIEREEKEIPDHLGLELTLMANMCLLEYVNVKNGKVELAKKYRTWQKGFLQDHLLQWAFEVLTAMNMKAKTEFYQTLALFMIDFLREEQETIV